MFIIKIFVLIFLIGFTGYCVYSCVKSVIEKKRIKDAHKGQADITEHLDKKE